jgi:hypothetical protein
LAGLRVGFKESRGLFCKAVSARGGRPDGPSLRASWAELLGRGGTVVFSFSFSAVFGLCLILYNKSFAGPKMMKIFV